MWSQTDYNRLMKPWLQEHYTEMYLRQNDRKSVVGERFIRILKKKKKMCIQVSQMTQLIHTAIIS